MRESCVSGYLFTLWEGASMVCLTCLKHLIGLLGAEWPLARWDFQTERGTQGDSRCAGDTNETWSKSDLQNIRVVKSHITDVDE